MARLISGVVKRCSQALVVGICGGIIGVLIDFDHVICAVLRGESIVETYGCRLIHPYLLPLSCLIFGAAIALGAGLLLAVVGNAAGTAP